MSSYFFFNDAATTEIYTLSLHDALPISPAQARIRPRCAMRSRSCAPAPRSEEHTSELQSRENLVCRLPLEKKKKNDNNPPPPTHTLISTSPLSQKKTK